MYGGRDETVSLICENRLIGVILDRFSTNVMIIPEGSSHFRVNVLVSVSPQFFGWLFGLEDNVELIAPQKAAEEYRRKLKAVLEQYG